MSKTKKLISLALALLMVLNIFSVVASAEGELADYAALTDYIEKNVPIDNNAGIYSADSYAAVAAILNGIDYDLPAEQQSTVDGYLTELQSAVAGLVADETQAVAQFSLTGTSAALHPGDTVEVTFGLTTNYRVISAGAVIIYDSTKFELLGGSSISSIVDHTEGCLSNYTLTGSNANTAKIFAQRNSNTAYWNTNEMKAHYTALNIGFALNSKIADPVVANGAVATMTFEVLSDVEFGTQGSIFISSDFNKTASFAGGLNYASRSVGEKMGPVSSCIAVGQTLNLSAAQLTLSVDHTIVADEAVAATCTATGLTAGSHCSECDEILVAQEVVPALGHEDAEWVVVTPATCTTTGLKTKTCSRCGNVIDSEEIAVTAHTEDAGTVTQAATCTEAGVMTYACTACGATLRTDVIEALGHNIVETEAVAATCTEAGVTAGAHCSRCDYVETATQVVPALGHNWDQGTVTTPATCISTGVKTYSCTRCDETYTEDIATGDHTPGAAAVETIDGAEKSVVRCTVCGEIISSQDIGAADYTALNAAIAAAEAIDPVTVYNQATLTTLLSYIDSVDTTLSAAHQDEVDAYTAQINSYMTNLLVSDQLRVVNGTASIDGTTITLNLNDGQTQISVYPTLKNGDRITFSNLDGARTSKSGTCYASINAYATITLADERQFTLEFAIKDPELDVADYTAVDAALEKAAAIVEDDVYDASTYEVLEAAVDAVVRDLPERRQSTVNGYATAITNALKNVKTVQELIRVSSNGVVTKSGDTIVVTRKTTSSLDYSTIFNTLSNGDTVTFLKRGRLSLVSDKIRYVVKQNTAAKISLENGREYNLLFVITPLVSEGQEALDAALARADKLVADDYYYFDDVTYALNQIDDKITEADSIDTLTYYAVFLNDSIDALKTIVSMLKVQYCYASKDGDTITLRKVPNQASLALYLKLTNGESITLSDMEGLKRYSDGSKYYTKTGGQATITLPDERQYTVIFTTEFANEFRQEFVQTKYIDGSKDFDEEKTVLSYTTSYSIARIYKYATTSRLSIDVDDYNFITEQSSYYEINSSALTYPMHGTATFLVHSDDGTDVTFKVTFSDLVGKTPFDYLGFVNASEWSLDGNVITVVLDRTQTSKAYIQIYKTIKGEPVVVSSPSSYVQNQNNSETKYTLRYQAAGADITLTYCGVEYVLNYVVISA